MAYIKKHWEAKTFQKGDKEMIDGLNHLEDGVGGAEGAFVVSNKGGKQIPNGSAVGGADSAFPGYNFVLGGAYQCAGDTTTDWMRPIVIGNDPATVEQSFKNAIPMRDGHGRLFAYCGTQKYHAELEYEVCNVGAVKYLADQKLKKLTLEMLSSDIGDIPEGETKRRMFTESGAAKAAAFFNNATALKSIVKVAFIPNEAGGAEIYPGTFAYATAGTLTEEHLQFMIGEGISEDTPDISFVVYYLTRNWIKCNTHQRVFALHPGFKIEITYIDTLYTH